MSAAVWIESTRPTTYLGKQRAWILTPTWSDGVASFKMLAETKLHDYAVLLT